MTAASTPVESNESTPAKVFYAITSKHTAVLVALIYATGFLINSLYDARFGVTGTELFKPRIFSTGVLFALMVCAPMVGMARSLGLFGLRRPSVYKVGAGAKYVELVLALDFWVVALSLRLAAALVFVPFEMISSGRALQGYVVYFVLFAAAGWSERRDVERKPWRAALVAFSAFIFGTLTVLRYNSLQFFGEVAWFYVVGIMGVIALKAAWSSARTVDWERWVFFVPTVLLFFSLAVYGHVKRSFGGGHPIPVEIHFSRPMSFSAATVTNALLVDENSEGWYLIHEEHDKAAYFIPRQSVTEIVFHPD